MSMAVGPELDWAKTQILLREKVEGVDGEVGVGVGKAVARWWERSPTDPLRSLFFICFMAS